MKLLTKTMLWAMVALAMQVGAPARTDAQHLKDLVGRAQKEGALVAHLTSSAAEESGELKAAFLKRFGLKIKMKISWGNESTEFRKAEIAMRAKGAPQFDVMYGEDGNNLNFINKGLLKKIDHWQALLAEIDPKVRGGKIKPEQVSPEPFMGKSFLFVHRLKVLLYNPRLVSEDQLPQTYADFAKSKNKGIFAVGPWSTPWEMGILVYPKDKWLKVVDGAGANAAGVMHYSRSLERILAGDLSFAPSNSGYYWAIKARDPKAPLGFKFFKDVTFMNRVFYNVPARSRRPAAATLFALWMTTDEARAVLKPTYYAENLEVGGNEVDIKLRKLLKESGSKVVNWFNTAESREKLKWLTSDEGKKYSRAVSRALTQRK